MEMINILHLSDLHIREQEHAYSLKETLIKDLSLLVKHKQFEGTHGQNPPKRIDVIVITGDLTWDNDMEQFTIVDRFLVEFTDDLKKISDNLKSPIFTGSRQNVIIIPGNHDTNWNATPDNLVSRFTNFNLFYSGFYQDEFINPDEILLMSQKRYFSVFKIKVKNDRKILFLGLNSSMNVTQKCPFGSLSKKYLEEIKNCKYWNDCYDLRIALLHHANIGSENHQPEQVNEEWQRIKKFLREDLSVKLILHGHLHYGESSESKIHGEKKLEVSSTGSTSADVKNGCLEYRVDRYQYQIISIHEDLTAYTYKRYFDRYRIGSSLSNGEWVADSDKFGRWVNPLDLGDADTVPREPPIQKLAEGKFMEFVTGEERFNISGENCCTILYHCVGKKYPSPYMNLCNNLKYLTGKEPKQVQAGTGKPEDDAGKGFDINRFDNEEMQKWENAISNRIVFIIDSSAFNVHTTKILMELKVRLPNFTVCFEKLSNKTTEEIKEDYNKGCEIQKIVYDFDEKEAKIDNGDDVDYGIIVRCPNFYKGDGIIFIIAGLHQQASIEGVEIVSKLDKLYDFLFKLNKDYAENFFEENYNFSDFYFECVFKFIKSKNAPQIIIKHFRRLVQYMGNNYRDEIEWQTLKSFSLFDQPSKIDASKIQLSSIHLDITENCPFECHRCIESGLRQFRDAEFPLPRVIEVLYRLKELGVKKIGLYGGEPMMHNQFRTIILAATGMGFSIYLTSNGYFLFDEEKRKAIITCKNFITCRFSIDAATPGKYIQVKFRNESKKEDMERKYGYKVSLEELRKNIKEISTNGVICEVSFLVTEKNYREIYEAFKNARNDGAKIFNIRPCTNQKVNRLEPDFNDKEKRAIKEQIIDIERDSYGISIIIPSWYRKYIFENLRPEEYFKNKPYYCYSRIYRIVISPINGERLIFCAYNRSNITDKCFQTELNNLFDNDKFNEIRNKYFHEFHPSEICENIFCNRLADNREVHAQFIKNN